MAFVLDDRVRETSTTTGTGTYTLAGAVTGYQSFAAIGNTNTTWYGASNGVDWEFGVGTYTAAGTTLARTTILSSSNADAAVNWGAGTKTIVCTHPASKSFIGPATSTDNAIARYDSTTGRILQNSGVTISDADVMAIPALLDLSGAAAGQIKFPATQNASADANTLDDYEEGTFTPTIDSTGGGAGTYTIQVGFYTKIGRAVSFSARCDWTAHSGSGTMTVGGLPFTSSSATNYISGVHLAFLNLTYAATLVSFISNTSTSVSLNHSASGAGLTALPLDTAATLIATGVYYI